LTGGEKMVSRSVIMKRIWAKRTKAEKQRLMKKIRKKWVGMKPIERRKAMPPKKYKGMTEAEIKKAVEREGKRYVPVGKYAWLDVGRPKRHYVLVQKVKYGWKKIKGLTPKAYLEQKMLKARKKWMAMTPAQRKRK